MRSRCFFPVEAARLPAIEFSTEALPQNQQFDAWRDNFRTLTELTRASCDKSGYAAYSEIWSFGHFSLSSMRSPPSLSRRTATHIRRDSLDHWVIYVAREGEMNLRTQSAERQVSRGQPLIISMDQVAEGQRSDMDWLSLFVARDAFPDLEARIDQLRGAPLQGAMAGLLCSYIESLHLHLPQMTEADLPQLAEATRAVVAACLVSGAPLGPVAEAQLGQARFGRVRQLVRKNLTSARLGPARLAQLTGMSRSQLYRLFEPVGGVARFIQLERLAQAHRTLADPDNTESIQRISDAVGFFDPSTFSRAFRREFGYSPTALRQHAASGGVIAARPAQVARKPQDLASALRHLALPL